METVRWIIVAAVVVAMLLVLLAIVTYNRLTRRRNEVRNAWSQIDVQLHRRHELIPNLVATVRGYAGHERAAVAAVVRARERALSSATDVPSRAAAENQLTSALRSLFAVVEAYPDLKATQNFASLQEEVASTENRIAFARQHYNDATMEYNTARDSLPAILVADALGFGRADHLLLDDPAAQEAPAIDFSDDMSRGDRPQLP